MQSNSLGSYHHGFWLAQILLPRRLRNEAPSRCILPRGSPYSLASGLWQTLGVSLWMLLARCVNGGTASIGRISMATFLAGNDADAHCVEGDQVLGHVILVTVQGPEKS